MKYALLQARNVQNLNKFVNEAISKGWELQGGASVVKIGVGYFRKPHFFYCQAVISRRDEASPIGGEKEPTPEPTLFQKIIGWGVTISFVVGAGWLLIHFFHKATS